MNKDMADSHIKPSDAVDWSKWRKIIRGNWNDSSCDSDAES